MSQGKLRELLNLVEDSPSNKQKRQRTLQEYGQWLSERQMREDAAVSFLAAGDLEEALREYQEGNHWQMALAVAGSGSSLQAKLDLRPYYSVSLAFQKRPRLNGNTSRFVGRLGYPPEKIRELSEALLETLTESGSLVAAAHVASEHLRDGDTAVTLLSQAREWRDALRLAALFDRQDLVETTIAPAAADAALSSLVRE